MNEILARIIETHGKI